MSIQLLRDWLSRYVSREIGLDEFEDWFLPSTWDIKSEDDASAYALASDVRLRLAEHDSGDWSDEELMDQLKKAFEQSTSTLLTR